MRERFLWICGAALVLITVGFIQNGTDTFLSRISGNLFLRTVKVESSVLEANGPLKGTEEIRLAPDENLIGLKFLGPTYGWVFSNKSLYKTGDGGKSWKCVDIEKPSGADFTSIDFVSTSNGWLALRRLATNDGASETTTDKIWLMHTSDGGQTWREQYQSDGIGINRVRFVNAQDGWAVGRGVVKDDPYLSKLIVLRTNDQGKHWIDVSSKVNQFIAVAESSVQDFATDVYAVESAKATLLTVRGRVLKTEDSGQSWKEVGSIKNEPAQTYIARLAYTPTRRIWVLGGTDSREGMWGILAHYEGEKWTIFKANLNLKDAIYLSDTQVLACGSALPISTDKPWDEKRDGVILYSADSGRNWAIIYRNAKIQSINALAEMNSDQILAVGNNGLVLQLDSPLKKASHSSSK